jgi:glycosyltransferase involved in cell wall biosynthesis
MRILLIGKAPPIEGGVSSRTFIFAKQLLENGHSIRYISNSDNVGYSYRCLLLDDDYKYIDSIIPPSAFHPISSKTNTKHIPFSPAFETRLIGAAIDSAQWAELIIGWYYQPYGVCAAILSKYQKKRCVLVHAGSDLGKLAQDPEFNTAYRILFEHATFIASNPYTERLIRERIVVDENADIIKLAGRNRIPYYFRDNHNYSISEYVDNSSDHIIKWNLDRNLIKEILNNNDKKTKEDYVTIGMYGKVSEWKGSFDIVRALGHLADNHIKFNFIYLAGGHPKILSKLCKIILKNKRLANQTWILPFIPPWRIPGFIRSCDIVAFLEREFPIEFHTPQIPREVLWCGTPLLLSNEIANSQYFYNKLKNRHNYIDAGDPKNTNDLSRQILWIIENKQILKNIGDAGKNTIMDLEKAIPSYDPIYNVLKQAGVIRC